MHSIEFNTPPSCQPTINLVKTLNHVIPFKFQSILELQRIDEFRIFTVEFVLVLPSIVPISVSIALVAKAPRTVVSSHGAVRT